MKTKIVKIISLVLACAACLTLLTSCNKKDDFKGNMRNIDGLSPGDIYAVMTFRDFEGELTFILFPSATPVAVEEFTKAANSGYYDGKTFHRVLEDMLIQGGALNMDGSDSTIPEKLLFDIEKHENARHFYGALCFAPELSTGKNYRQFYIVTASESVDIEAEADALQDMLNEYKGDTITAEERKRYENLVRDLKKLPTEVKERYLEKGGLHLLDGTSTVFGQLISGHRLLEEVSAVEVVSGNAIDDANVNLNDGKGRPSRPLDTVFIEKIRIIMTEEPEQTKKK